ncbi:MAG: hypothetical protein M0T74_10695 [Desulfitobacterium hafniense]|nr:hypothetical protein [Desulfitobacterium hafniense]
MRLNIPTYNPVKECTGCITRDESVVSGYILSFQLADQFLSLYGGSWKLSKNEIKLTLEGVTLPLAFDLSNATLSIGTLTTQILSRYSAEKGLTKMIGELISDLNLPTPSFKRDVDPLFTVFVKMIEIFHARCGLNILPVEGESGLKGWELCLCKEGPRGWISQDGIAENRFGERADITSWYSLRPEKTATYLFGFNRFCKNFASPFKTLESLKDN